MMLQNVHLGVNLQMLLFSFQLKYSRGRFTIA